MQTMLVEAPVPIGISSYLDTPDQVIRITNLPDELVYAVEKEIDNAAYTATGDEKKEDTHPLELVFYKYPVNILRGNGDILHGIDESIESLDRLIHQLATDDSTSSSSTVVYSPGFMTKNHAAPWVHHPHRFQGRYETLAQSIVIPLPHPSIALLGCSKMKKAWMERRAWAASIADDASSNRTFCSCIQGWDHLRGKRDILFEVANQALEQLMIQEADECLRNRFVSCDDVEKWNGMYSPKTCLSPQQLKHSYIADTSIRLLSNRNEYAKAYAMAALASNFTIDINICYLFPRDPLHRYILLDLLPYIAKELNVTIRIIADVMTMESALLKAPLQVENSVRVAAEGKASMGFLEFLDHLPSTSPCFDRAQRPFTSSLSFLREIIKLSNEIPNQKYQIRWWCARDSKMKYPIKNHIKCHVFDSQEVICGGSNVAPLLGCSDCDIHISGGLGLKYHELFNDMWEASSGDELLNTLDVPKSFDIDGSLSSQAPVVNEIRTVGTEVSRLSSESSTGSLQSESSSSASVWTDESCFATLVQSCPSSDGEDVILRHVLGAIATAKESIILCMGHCNVTPPVVKALTAATDRGVSVRILINSWYSCDLRTGQRDLFLSLRDLVILAPKVEVWVTALLSQREQRSYSRGAPLECYQDNDEKVPFLHSKYVVIDGNWSAVGSWNMWTRGAFYEMEAEIMVHSEEFASSLTMKFEMEREAHTLLVSGVDDIDFFCPKGCCLCHEFGPFYSSD